MIDLLIEYNGVQFPVIKTILDKLASDYPFGLQDLEQISQRIIEKCNAEARRDFDMLLKLNEYRNQFPVPAVHQPQLFTMQQLVMPAERFAPKTPTNQATDGELLQFFSRKVIYMVVLNQRARHERLNLARGIVYDMELQGMI